MPTRGAAPEISWLVWGRGDAIAWHCAPSLVDYMAGPDRAAYDMRQSFQMSCLSVFPCFCFCSCCSRAFRTAFSHFAAVAQPSHAQGASLGLTGEQGMQITSHARNQNTSSFPVASLCFKH